MRWRLKAFLVLFIGAIVVPFFFPSVSYAVDYSITGVQIDAYLQENGDVAVTEKHTYAFDGKFNGITREIVPKNGTKIMKLKATENGKSLRVEKEEDLYKIHRKGKDETITVEIAYTIKNGVDVYADVAEFYWPFFDDRNESSYDKMNIIIHPPKETKDVIAFGYDTAFDKEEMLADGSVLFQLGEVPSGENGDIRVAYNAALFPGATITADKMMKEEILGAKKKLYEQAVADMKMREKLSKIALFIIPIFSALLLITIIQMIIRERMKKLGVEQAIQQAFFIPDEKLSLPATILFIKGTSYQPGEAMSAALLDLVRRGYVVKMEDNRFQLVKRSGGLLKHEQVLVDFLFNEIGTGDEFTFDNLRTYMMKKKNHEKFQTQTLKWQQAIRQEIKGKKLYDQNAGTRLFLLIAGLLLFPFLFLFPIYDLFGWFTAALILAVTYFVLAASYITKSWDGWMIVKEWRFLEKGLPKLSLKEWEDLTNDEQMRGFIYGIGMKDEGIIEKNKEFVQSFKHPLEHVHNHGDALNIQTMLLIGPYASTHFHSAYKTSQSTTSSSSSSSTGGGVGGGGGGSGAF